MASIDGVDSSNQKEGKHGFRCTCFRRDKRFRCNDDKNGKTRFIKTRALEEPVTAEQTDFIHS